jgi:hypothetical protein
VKCHEGPRSDSPGQPPPEVGNVSVDRVAERTVERCAGILGQWGPVAIEDDKEGDSSSHSFVPLASAVRTSSLRLRESGSPGRQPWWSVLAGERPVGTGGYWVVNEAIRAYEYAQASEPNLTSSSEVLQAIKGIKVGKARDNLSHARV